MEVICFLSYNIHTFIFTLIKWGSQIPWISHPCALQILKTLGGFGWSGVEGWGENADNCNWITINFLLNSKKSFLKEWLAIVLQNTILHLTPLNRYAMSRIWGFDILLYWLHTEHYSYFWVKFRYNEVETRDSRSVSRESYSMRIICWMLCLGKRPQ